MNFFMGNETTKLLDLTSQPSTGVPLKLKDSKMMNIMKQKIKLNVKEEEVEKYKALLQCYKSQNQFLLEDLKKAHNFQKMMAPPKKVVQKAKEVKKVESVAH